jgi:hypothetical protein
MEHTAFDAIAPLVRQGQNPELAVGMTVQAIRNGNASLQEVVDTMGNLGPAARAARMSLDEFQQGLDQFAEQAEGAGAYRNQGVALGRGLSEVTGLTPQQLQPIMASPMFQAMAFQHQGVMPNAVGSLTTRQFTQETGRLIDFTMRAARPFGSRVSPTGERLSPERARQNQIIQAAAIAGMDPETYTRLLDNRGRLDNLAAGHEAITDFQAVLRQRDESMRNLPPEQRVENRQNIGAAGQRLTPAQERMNERREAQVHRLDTLTNRGWQRVEHALTGAAPGKPGDKSDEDRVEYFRRVRDIENIRDPKQRLTEAQKLLDEQAKQTLKEDQPAVRLDLSPEAKRLVRQMGGSNDPAKDKAQAGGEQVNKDRTKPGKFAPFHWGG